MLAERERLVEVAALGIDHLDLGSPLRETKGLLHGLGQPLANPVSADQTINDHLDGVLLVARQREG